MLAFAAGGRAHVQPVREAAVPGPPSQEDVYRGRPVRLPVVLAVIATVAGIVWALVVGTLFGVFLIIGGVGSLGVTLFPMAIDRIVGFLSTGSFGTTDVKA
jgi:hypothetical protein